MTGNHATPFSAGQALTAGAPVCAKAPLSREGEATTTEEKSRKRKFFERFLGLVTMQMRK